MSVYHFDADDYQFDTREFMTNTVRDMEPKVKLLYLACGLGGEAGEVQEKIKKIVRDKDGIVSAEDRVSLEKELGDVCWYIARIADEIVLLFTDILNTNLDKLQDRKDRGKLHGQGDNR